MPSNHLATIQQLPLPLVHLIEPGIGFGLGNPALAFALIGSDGNTWTYADPQTGLRATACLRTVGQTVIISLRLENAGTGTVSGIMGIEPLRLVFRHPAGAWRHIWANGGTTEDFYPPTAYRIQERTQGDISIGSHPEGRSSSLHLPILLSLASTAADSEGIFCAMEWSGIWSMRLGREADDRSRLSVGIQVDNLSLAPGERLALPDVHLGFFRGGPEGGTNAVRRYLYDHVCPAYQGRPTLPRVSYDHWFGIDNRLDLSLMRSQADRAAELGVEVFVVDAAWFPGDFPEGVGNWDRVDLTKFPDGLEPLAEHVRSLGMDFGLWFEVERAVEGTTIVREHPEWFITAPSWGRKQFYHLNLAIPAAQDHLIELVGSWIRRLDLRWSRWDYNIEPLLFWKAADPTLKIQFDYCAGLYRVLDTLMREHPQWMVEGCASGGRRIDLGTMRRAHTYWFSDQTELPRLCRYMQARANRFLPGHLLNSSVAVGAQATDAGFDDTAILSRMLGKLSFDGGISRWSAGLTARMAVWVDLFKAIRHLLVQDFHQLLPQPQTVEDWDAVQFVAYAGDEAAVFAFAGSGGGQVNLRLRGLRPERSYAVTRLPDGASAIHSGRQLIAGGLPVELPPDQGGLWRIRLSESSFQNRIASA